MSNKHMIFRVDGEHFSFFVTMEVTPGLIESCKRRRALAERLDDEDDAFLYVDFAFYGFDAYEDGDSEVASYEDGNKELVSELPDDLGTKARVDLGQLNFGAGGDMFLTFYIKHVLERHETFRFTLEDLVGGCDGE